MGSLKAGADLDYALVKTEYMLTASYTRTYMFSTFQISSTT